LRLVRDTKTIRGILYRGRRPVRSHRRETRLDWGTAPRMRRERARV